MKTCRKIPLILFALLVSASAFSQSAQEKKALLNRGIALNDSGKYEEALNKYGQLIKIDSTYEDAYYETAYTLFSSGKEKDAIPYLNKVLSLNPNSAQSFDMLGSIYDDLQQPDQAIACFKSGIKIDSAYQRLHFNIAITYYRTKQYADAEDEAIKAIKLDPTHASSQRIYAMATYHENKRGASLMAWCSFLLLEPESKRSAEAMVYLKNIINYGISDRTSKGENIKYDVSSGASNLMMPLAVVEATQGQKNLGAIDSIQLQLTALFKIAHSIADDEKKRFAYTYLGDYFESLGNSTHMAAFAHYITLSAYRNDDLDWFKDHDKELKAFSKWLEDTKRSF